MTNFTTWRSLVDGTEYGAIPDVGDLHSRYDASELSTGAISTLTDLTGNGYDMADTGSPEVLADAQNGLNVLDYAASDYHSVDYASSISQPLTIFLAFRIPQTESPDPDDAYIIGDTDGNGRRSFFTNYEDSGDPWALFSGSNVVTDGASDTNWNIATILFDGADSILRLNGTQVINADPGSDAASGLVFSALPHVGSQYEAELQLGEFLQYPMDKSSIFSDGEQYLSDKWGITI